MDSLPVSTYQLTWVTRGSLATLQFHNKRSHFRYEPHLYDQSIQSDFNKHSLKTVKLYKEMKNVTYFNLTKRKRHLNVPLYQYVCYNSIKSARNFC